MARNRRGVDAGRGFFEATIEGSSGNGDRGLLKQRAPMGPRAAVFVIPGKSGIHEFRQSLSSSGLLWRMSARRIGVAPTEQKVNKNSPIPEFFAMMTRSPSKPRSHVQPVQNRQPAQARAPRRRSLEKKPARAENHRAAQRRRLNPEIAAREGLTERRIRQRVQEILARRAPRPPAGYVALQVSRLSEALLVAYSAMANQNLGAVDRVVRIVRELDRYHGLACSDFAEPAAPTPPRRLPRPQPPLALPLREETVTLESL